MGGWFHPAIVDKSGGAERGAEAGQVCNGAVSR